MKVGRFSLAAGLVLLGLSQIASAQYLYGIDVSRWRKVNDWNAVKNSGRIFAFTKATEEADYVDPTYHTHMTGAHKAGMYIGAFHFATPYAPTRNDSPDPASPSDAIAEADHFANTIMPYLKYGYLRPVLDLERGDALSTTVLSNWVNAFMNRVRERTGVEPLIYCNSSYARYEVNSTLAKYDLWLARWTYDPNVPPKATDSGVWGANGWDFWQYSNEVPVPGVSSPTMDGDVFKGTLWDLKADFMIHMPGDANYDGRVDVADLGRLAANYGLTSGATWTMGDFNADGRVDIGDLGILAGKYGQIASVAAVPEPMTLVLLGLGGLGLVRRRRQKQS